MAKPPRLYALDALRGLCAIAIMIYHFYSWNGIEYHQVSTFGVYLFYVLSGFSMWYVYSRKSVDAGMLRAFFVARFARIFPLYFLAGMGVFFAKLFFLGSDSVFNLAFLHRFLMNITMLFGLATPGHFSHVPGGWSIGIECVFYLTFPLFVLFARRLITLAILLMFSLALNQLYVSVLFANRETVITHWVEYIHFPVFLVYFVAGMLAAEIYERLRMRAQRLPQSIWPMGLLMLAAIAFIFTYPAITPENFLFGGHYPLLILAAMIAMLAGAWMPEPTAPTREFFSFLGDISYSTYLMHFFMYNSVKLLLTHFYPGCPLLLLMAVSATATLLLAYGLYRFFEAPARTYINRRFGQRSW
jgi:exopolysaccharide production protein ExoZ